MKEIKINVDDSIIASVKEIIEPLGFDTEILIKILLNRISRERNLDFLLINERKTEDSKPFNENPTEILKSSVVSIDVNGVRDMRKSLAISIFRSRGIVFNGNITFASKNRTAYNYWANPPFEVLEKEWFLILNDWANKMLYLFKIPSKAISHDLLVARADNNNQIDLQVLYNDPTFRDTRSNYIFKDFLVMTEKY